jgi:hypothetical protein
MGGLDVHDHNARHKSTRGQACHYVTMGMPVSADASVTPPRFVTFSIPIERMNASAFPERWPDRQYTT